MLYCPTAFALLAKAYWPAISLPESAPDQNPASRAKVSCAWRPAKAGRQFLFKKTLSRSFAGAS